TTKVVVVPVIDHQAADSLLFINTIRDSIRKNDIDFQTFSAKIKVHFEGNDGTRNDVNAFVRLKKDSVLWVNINVLLGIDAFRVLITPDSVKVVDKLKKTVTLRSVNSLQELTGIPLTFKELQALIIGNSMFLNGTISAYKKSDKTISLTILGSVFKHLLTVSNDDYSLQHSKLDDVDAKQSRTADITYGDYQSKNGVRFATYRRITVSENAKLDIEMEYKQFDFNGDLSFPFNIPKNYKSK